MPIYRDQLNREVNLPAVPKRIISVVPSQTELLFYLGLGDEVIGITKYCIHPADKFKVTEKVGGTKQLDIQKIKALRPDLIIANKEENERTQIEELVKHFTVWISHINDLNGALNMINAVGELVGRVAEARMLSNKVDRLFKETVVPASPLKTAYLIWRKPYMAAAGGTFIDAMLRHCGLANAFDLPRYPEISHELLIAADPGLVLLSSEPYPFREKHIAELRSILPKAIIKLVDGELFSWYGSRLLYAPQYFKRLMENVNSLHIGQ